MRRECIASVVLAACPGCSLLLDFSDSAAPHDAMIDAPYTPDQCAYGEPNDSLATPLVIAATDTGPGAICPDASGAGVDDHDFYRFTVPAATAKVTVSVSFTNMLGDLDLQLWDPAMTTMPIAKSRGVMDVEKIVCPSAPNTTPVCPALAAGDYVFEVLPGTPGATNLYAFAIALE